ncbi:MAG: SHOCT domain-containing protein [Woeseiaceae bacterium]
MNLPTFICGLLLSITLALPAHGQTDDAAAERAKLGNARIQAETERQARAEQERLEQEAATLAAKQRVADSDMPANRADMYRVLEQLRELGELKDAGYLTDEEFQQLKDEILSER